MLLLAHHVLFRPEPMPSGLRRVGLVRVAHDDSYEVINKNVSGSVAVCGRLGCSEVMCHLRLNSSQKYVGWLMWVNHATQKRKDEIVSSFAKACNDPSVQWLLTEVPIDCIGHYVAQDPEVLAGLRKFTYFAEGRYPNVLFYRKKTVLDEGTFSRECYK